MSDFYNIFSCPVWKTKITKQDYDKDLILNEMLHNFKKDPKRNTWDDVMNTSFKSNWHHSNNDESNSNFLPVSYEQSGLTKCMDSKIREFMSYLSLISDVNYFFQITNYTVSTEGYYLTSHGHGKDSFSSVLFLQFDKLNHPPTYFNNPYTAADQTRCLQKDLYESFDNKNPFFSYMQDTWAVDVKEDDYIIFPGHIKHEVPPVGKSDKERITISCNIKVYKNVEAN